MFRILIAALAFLSVFVVMPSASADGYDYINIVHVEWHQDVANSFIQVNSAGKHMFEVTAILPFGRVAVHSIIYSDKTSFDASVYPSEFRYSLGSRNFAKLAWDKNCGSVDMTIGLEQDGWTTFVVTNRSEIDLQVGFGPGYTVKVSPGYAQGAKTSPGINPGEFVVLGSDGLTRCGEAQSNWLFAAPGTFVPFAHFQH